MQVVSQEGEGVSKEGKEYYRKGTQEGNGGVNRGWEGNTQCRCTQCILLTLHIFRGIITIQTGTHAHYL